jgi:hypothetical protein
VKPRCDAQSTLQFAKLVLEEGLDAARKDLESKRRLAAKAARDKIVDASNAIAHALVLALEVAEQTVKAAAAKAKDTVKRKRHQ